ncbi:hypothetical protein PISMIDRAFT_176697 [Pisolithus microcarpus 441]|uniref:Uncharacterized protein n=1 Tax=Pisolithus microcarpus 441 TaxID=765257 RepID=A0A0C9Y297_9AGAM|nr:hypothetical protein BKA83DRAFT_176697 [Pisolithus microcarpus]KIK18845.1 hypothetical protein PISMIDRAFT_176697 [Pisolithus microcarpus 441]
MDISKVTIVALSGCHCLRSLYFDPAGAMDTDDAFITQAPPVWPNIEDLSLRGWQRSKSHRLTLEGICELLRGCPRLLSPTRQIDTRTLSGQGSEKQSSTPKKLRIFLSHRGLVGDGTVPWGSGI